MGILPPTNYWHYILIGLCRETVHIGRPTSTYQCVNAILILQVQVFLFWKDYLYVHIGPWSPRVIYLQKVFYKKIKIEFYTSPQLTCNTTNHLISE